MSEYGLTRPIGEVFTNENGVQLKVVPALDNEDCGGCYYDYGPIDCRDCKLMGACSFFYRTDKTSVIFVEVKGGQQ